MKQFVIAACVLFSASVWAQEIGTEIQPGQNTQTQTQSSGTTNYDNPYGQSTTTATTTQAKPEGAAPAPAMAPVTIPGPHKGEFGLRASFGGQGVPSAPTSGSSGGPSGSFAFRYLATDTVGVDFDVGLGMGVGSKVSFGFNTGFGITAYMGSAEKPIRPFFTGGLTFGKNVSSSGNDFALGINVGGGGEYWFNDHFSLDARLLIGVPINLQNTDVIAFGTFMPGLGANFYF